MNFQRTLLAGAVLSALSTLSHAQSADSAVQKVVVPHRHFVPPKAIKS